MTQAAWSGLKRRRGCCGNLCPIPVGWYVPGWRGLQTACKGCGKAWADRQKEKGRQCRPFEAVVWTDRLRPWPAKSEG
jgi:hypothetical protein